MRDASSYRGAIRNVARNKGELGAWKRGSAHAIAANATANLDERRKQCAEAFKLVLNAVMSMAPGTRRGIAASDALRTYWSMQRRTRVVARILFELGPATPAKAIVA